MVTNPGAGARQCFIISENGVRQKGYCVFSQICALKRHVKQMKQVLMLRTLSHIFP